MYALWLKKDVLSGECIRQRRRIKKSESEMLEGIAEVVRQDVDYSDGIEENG